MFDSEIVVVPAVFGIPSIVLMVQMWFRHREKMASLPDAQPQSDVENRLERIEQAVESIAVEMERIGEGQRFVTKLLADRPGQAAGGASVRRERVITPH